MVPHFFCGGTSGVFADKLGGKGSKVLSPPFIGGIFLAFLPAMLLPALGNPGFENSALQTLTSRCGGIIGEAFTRFGQIAIYLICFVLVLALLARLPFK